jgi:signal transduction histidine kinase
VTRPSRAQLLDLGLAAAVTAAGVAETWVPFSSRQGEGSAAVVTVFTCLAGVALTQRRTQPVLAGLLVLWTWPLLFLVTPLYVLFFGQFVPMGIALFSMARYGRGRVPFVGAAAGASTLLFFDLFVEVLQSPGEIIFHWGVFTIVWSFGWALRRFEERARESTRRAVEAEVGAARLAMAAVVEERTRIARELHDVIAHSVSLMVVQAGAAEQVDDDPELVRRSLETIRRTGTEALAEMRRVVDVLREPDARGGLEPQPGLAALPLLLDEVRASGLEVSVQVTGNQPRLPAGLDLAAYRIVQEALTNVRRHASARHVRVGVEYADEELRIEVCDDGVGSRGDASDGGHGLLGMRERAALYGGHVEAGSTAPGFRVRAVLPLDRAGSPA